MAEAAPGELRYKAFLSYSHKDSAAAARLHRRLEGYRLPRRLVGRDTERGRVPERLAPIFRDRDELPAVADLSETVRAALARSEALIVLCSPAGTASLWVAEEIRVFRALHPERPVLAAVIAGEPVDCFPEPLRTIDADGSGHEPLAADLRPGADGARLGLLKLVAGLTGVGLDDLVQRDAARRIRRVTAVTAVALAAMLIMAALTVFALGARAEAERQRAEAEGLIEFMLTGLRERLRGVGRLDVQDAVNQRALHYYSRQGELSNLGPDSLDRRARVLLALGEDELNRDRFPAALAAFREAHRTTAEQLERAPGDLNRIFAHSQSEYWVGYADYKRRNRRGARQAWLRYKALTDRLVAAEPRNPRWTRERGYAEGSLCTIAVEEVERDALRICSSALQRMVETRALSPGDLRTVLDVANRHGWLADAWNLAGRWDRVLVHRAEQERLVRWLLQREPGNRDFQDFWMRTQFTYGELLEARGARREARQWFVNAAETAAQLRRADPENVSWSEFQQRINDRLRN